MRQAWPMAVCCLLLSACGEAKIAGDDVEDFVRSKLGSSGASASVVCPDERPAKQGDRFECTIDLKDGSQEIVTVEQTDDDGHVRLIADRQTRLGRDTVKLKRENLEFFLSKQLPDVKAGSVKCPDDEPIEFGRVTRCTALSGKDGKTYVVSLLQFDKLGNVRITGVEPRE